MEKKIQKRLWHIAAISNQHFLKKKSLIETFEFPNVYGYGMSALSLYMHTCHRSSYNGNNETFKNLGYKKITKKNLIQLKSCFNNN